MNLMRIKYIQYALLPIFLLRNHEFLNGFNFSENDINLGNF
jgi:hypothetical protein